MRFLEKDLEEIIFTTPNEKLNERGLFIKGKKFRQLKIGNYGRADIITAYRTPYELKITVYELKKEKAGISAFLQALRYAKGIKDYLHSRNFNQFYEINIVLIAKEIDLNSDYIFLEQFMSGLKNYSYNYCLNGLEFRQEKDYSLNDKGFRL